MGVVTSSLASLSVVLFVPFAMPFASWQLPPNNILVVALCAGMLIQVSQVLYFQALDNTEAGIVAAYWNLTPALLPVASYWMLGKILAGWHYIGVAILVVSSAIFCLVDTNLKARRNSFLLMLLASTLQVVALLLEKRVFETASFFIGFLVVIAGIIVTGALPLLAAPVRRAFVANLATLRPAVPLIIGIEVANLIALLMSQRAISLGVPSLVAAVEATVPAYTFALAIVLLAVTRRFGDVEARTNLGIKVVLVAAMAVGVGLVSG